MLYNDVKDRVCNVIILNNISKVYKSKKGIKTQALEDVSFSLPSRGMFFILGKSGSGKSTLLNIIGGLDKYNQGELIVDNKSTKKFRNRDYDYYRNTYVGFIFQEFNLLDEYNVYDNISLSLKLQKKKTNHAMIDNLLKLVGIPDLGKRRINELSGGQKQRVAIARALIKNPKIILADEPTGSLDNETGRQIFSLLKNISREKLVIIVSHDRESAMMYSDGIIELQDGKIVSNNVCSSIDEVNHFKSIKSHLPFFSSLKFSFLNLGTKKLKLIFTIILISMALIFFGSSKILSYFDIEESYAKTMVDTKEEMVKVSKSVYNEFSQKWYVDYNYHNLIDKDINRINKDINVPTYIQYKLNENNADIGLEINYKDIFRDQNKMAYYMMALSSYNFHFIEADPSFIKEEILGKYPSNYDEIMIHKYIADYIMKAGVLLYNDSLSFKDEYYIPNSYEELIQDGKYLRLGSTKVKVVGIILDDLSRYEELKTTPYNSIDRSDSTSVFPKNNSIYAEFSTKVLTYAGDIYVKKGFIQNIPLEKNYIIDENYYNAKINYNNKLYSPNSTYSYLKNKIIIYNGEKNVIMDKLNDNELIVNESYLDMLSNNNYSKLKEIYLQDYHQKEKSILDENKKIGERNKVKIEEYTKKIEAGILVEEPILEDEKDFDFRTDEELTLDFLKNYLLENAILNSLISMQFSGGELNDDKGISTYDNIKIVGIQLEDNSKFYMSNNIASELMRDNSSMNAVVLKSDNKTILKNVFRDFPISDSKYVSSSIYSPIIDNISTILVGWSKLFFYASIVFWFFALLLLTNFIVNSIYYNKKTIGILRAIGARKIDVFRIYFNEGLIIGVVSLIIAIIILYIGIDLANGYISSNLFFTIELIMFSKENLLILIGSVMIIIFLSSLFTVRKISKMKPVDAILNKS